MSRVRISSTAPLFSLHRLCGRSSSRGCSSMAEFQPSKLATWVRFPSPAPVVAADCAQFAATLFAAQRAPVRFIVAKCTAVFPLCKPSQPQFASRFARAPYKVHARFGCPLRSVAAPPRIEAGFDAVFTGIGRSRTKGTSVADCAQFAATFCCTKKPPLIHSVAPSTRFDCRTAPFSVAVLCQSSHLRSAFGFAEVPAGYTLPRIPLRIQACLNAVLRSRMKKRTIRSRVLIKNRAQFTANAIQRPGSRVKLGCPVGLRKTLS